VINVWLAIWAILDFASVNHEPPNPEIPEVVCEYFADGRWGLRGASHYTIPVPITPRVRMGCSKSMSLRGGGCSRNTGINVMK